MNKFYIMGKIKSIKYGLVDKGKIYAIAILNLKVKKSKNYITVICKNENADFVYRFANVNYNIVLDGTLRQVNNSCVVLAKNIETIFGGDKNGEMDKKSV